ncbi:hypothetical protein [Desulfosporosinus sp. OT]|uniref:hypothetical protein n=1 Tax=Desulfosporosinus sp. OT TaxID=913865 RepID=UPI000223A8FB|nr:hypothetical protein [Desulfosporosinus sp. OT]EGW39053.1 hypothetical protein DOT_3004 [Desulfosporosinus sp. OT]ODA39957.1 hypothetical protein DSBG_3248 [Desulfosporosinus sp. BG]
MHCELLDKDVLIEVWKEIRDEKDKDIILKTVYKCSECYVEVIVGRKIFKYCDKMGSEKCLLKQYVD